MNLWDKKDLNGLTAYDRLKIRDQGKTFCKDCPDCGEKMVYSFRQALRSSVKKNTICISCSRKPRRAIPYSNEFIKEAKENVDRIALYYLPAHYYVGITENILRRLKDHQGANKRNIEDYKVLGWYDTIEEAASVEAQWHAKGYYGSVHTKDTTYLNRSIYNNKLN